MLSIDVFVICVQCKHLEDEITEKEKQINAVETKVKDEFKNTVLMATHFLE